VGSLRRPGHYRLIEIVQHKDTFVPNLAYCVGDGSGRFELGADPAMSAKNAVLGLVIERPGYGYDLARRLETRFGSSGFAPTGVYSALDQLSSEALVRSAGSRVGATNERAAPRTIYEATRKGVDHFEEWMLGCSSLAPVRDELYMKIALSKPHNLSRLIELARAQEEECLARLQDLRHPATTHSSGGPPRSWSDVAVLLVRDAEVKQLQARVEWLQKARVIMDKLNCARAQSVAQGDRIA
jgi:DNA-binding PadR family transcriptional regulator